MTLFRLLPLAAGLAVTACAAPPDAPRPARHLFVELLGKTDAEVDAKIDTAWRQLFHGDPAAESVYFPVGEHEAYLADVASGDVRTEGMSYGMMIAVQLDHRVEFDRLWQWAYTHMRHADGPRRGYFAWHCQFDGTPLDPGSASDGEEWFAMALLFASHRWGDGTGIFNYGGEAQALLRAMLHQPTTAGVTAIFNLDEKQVRFVPNPTAGKFTDPSYHLPAFYVLWSQWDTDPADRKFWSEAADVSRQFLHRAAHPVTGLMPEYARFDGQPFPGFGKDKMDFRYDAWRTLANVALDHAWFAADPWQIGQSNRVLNFLHSFAPAVPDQFSLAGQPVSSSPSAGLNAMAAVAGLAADPAIARPWVQLLWDAPIPSGQWRYYNGLLYLLGLLEVSGRFQPIAPPTPAVP